MSAFPFIDLYRPEGKLNFIDHVVGNQGNNQMANVVEQYEKNLQFHRFWSIDDDLVSDIVDCFLVHVYEFTSSAVLYLVHIFFLY